MADREGSPSPYLNTVPTALQRQGDFSQTFNANGALSVVYNPFTTAPNPNGGRFRPAIRFRAIGFLAV